MRRGKVDAIIGIQRGDEGKGRFTDILAPHYAVVARYNGGANAGHTVFINGVEINLHQVPMGILHDDIMNLITHSSLFDPELFVEERAGLEPIGREIHPDNLMVGYNSYVVMPHHKLLDAWREGGADRHGSTLNGIAFAARSKEAKEGGNSYLIKHDLAKLGKIASAGMVEFRKLVKEGKFYVNAADSKEMIDAWLTGIEESGVADLIGNTDDVVQKTLKNGKDILAEGAQASLLDVTRGRVPFTTSSRTGIAGVQDGLGVGPRSIGKVIGVAKLFPTSVGDGINVSEIEDPIAREIVRGKRGEVDGEFGKTTGRERLPGWFDIPAANSAIIHNEIDELIIPKLDIAEKLKAEGIGKIALITHYIDKDGRELTESPPSEYEIARIAGVRKVEKPIWDGSIKQARRRKDLPEEAENILKFIEKRTGKSVWMAGVGPGRDEVIRG